MSSHWNFFHDAPRNYNTPPEQPRPSPPLDASPHQPTPSTSQAMPQQPLASGISVEADFGTDIVAFPAVGTVFESLDHFKKAVYRAGESQGVGMVVYTSSAPGGYCDFRCDLKGNPLKVGTKAACTARVSVATSKITHEIKVNASVQSHTCSEQARADSRSKSKQKMAKQLGKVGARRRPSTGADTSASPAPREDAASSSIAQQATPQPPTPSSSKAVAAPLPSATPEHRKWVRDPDAPAPRRSEPMNGASGEKKRTIKPTKHFENSMDPQVPRAKRRKVVEPVQVVGGKKKVVVRRKKAPLSKATVSESPEPPEPLDITGELDIPHSLQRFPSSSSLLLHLYTFASQSSFIFSRLSRFTVDSKGGFALAGIANVSGAKVLVEVVAREGEDGGWRIKSSSFQKASVPPEARKKHRKGKGKERAVEKEQQPLDAQISSSAPEIVEKEAVEHQSVASTSQPEASPQSRLRTHDIPSRTPSVTPSPSAPRAASVVDPSSAPYPTPPSAATSSSLLQQVKAELVEARDPSPPPPPPSAAEAFCPPPPLPQRPKPRPSAPPVFEDAAPPTLSSDDLAAFLTSFVSPSTFPSSDVPLLSTFLLDTAGVSTIDDMLSLLSFDGSSVNGMIELAWKRKKIGKEDGEKVARMLETVRAEFGETA